jgi:hypothetical protein
VAFAQDFLDVPVPAAWAVAHLGEGEDALLALLAEHGLRAGQELRLRLVPPGSHVPLPSKRVRVDTERPYRRGDGCVLPFHWAATDVPGLFPTMQAELEVAPLGDDEVQLIFRGQYRPPLGGVGRMADAVLMHRIVERSIRAFLLALGETLERRAAQREHAVSRG